MEEPWALLLSLAGLFSICGGVFDWDFFMNNYKARGMVKLFGRNGARVFYMVLGTVIALLGVGFAVGFIPTKSA